MFNPAHDAIVLYALETGAITESSDGVTPATLPAAPTSLGILGYTDLPETQRGLNNSKGFAIGLQGAAYNKRGRREPTVTVNIRPGNVAALANLFPDPTTGKLPYLAIYVQVRNGYIDQYRFCKPSSVELNFAGGDGKGGELTVAVTFQATAHVRAASVSFPAASAIRALGIPLMWHDVRQFTIADSTGDATLPLRQALMSFSATVETGLERKNERPNWGDDSPLSNTCYDLLEHQKTVTGEIALHERLDDAYFAAAANSQDWGDIVIAVSNTPGGSNKFFALTLQGCFPTGESMQSGEASKEIDFKIPFAANDVEFDATTDVAADE